MPIVLELHKGKGEIKCFLSKKILTKKFINLIYYKGKIWDHLGFDKQKNHNNAELFQLFIIIIKFQTCIYYNYMKKLIKQEKKKRTLQLCELIILHD